MSGAGAAAGESAPAVWGVFAWRGRLVWRVGGIVKPPTRGYCNQRAVAVWRAPRSAGTATIAANGRGRARGRGNTEAVSRRRRRAAQPGAQPARSGQAIRAFLSVVRRRLMWRTALHTAGYGLGILGVVVLLLALVAESMGPAAFWPSVTAGAAGAFVVIVLLVGVWSAGVGDAPGSRGRPPRGRADAGDGQRSAVGRRARRARVHRSARGGGVGDAGTARSRTTWRAP